jgi:putative endonuclease
MIRLNRLIRSVLIHPPKFLNFMYYVYILQSIKDKNLYIGCTNDLKKRFLLHNNGKIFSTKKRKPFKLIYYEAFLNRKDAFTREQWLKTGWGRNQIKKILNNYLKI